MAPSCLKRKLSVGSGSGDFQFDSNLPPLA